MLHVDPPQFCGKSFKEEEKEKENKDKHEDQY